MLKVVLELTPGHHLRHTRAPSQAHLQQQRYKKVCYKKGNGGSFQPLTDKPQGERSFILRPTIVTKHLGGGRPIGSPRVSLATGLKG